MAVGRQLELVAQLEDQHILSVTIAVEILLESAGEVTIGLNNWVGIVVLRRKE